MTNITTENAAELLQPIFDAAGKQFSEQAKTVFGDLAKDQEARLATLEKAVKAPEAPTIDLTDAEAVEAHLATLRKPVEIDLNDADAVEAHLATLRKSKASDSETPDPKDEKIATLEKELAKARRGSNLRVPATTVVDSDGEELSDEDFLADINDDLQTQEA